MYSDRQPPTKSISSIVEGGVIRLNRAYLVLEQKNYLCALDNYLTPRWIFLLHASMIKNQNDRRLKRSNQLIQDEKFKRTGL